jgi:hypothetical protein
MDAESPSLAVALIDVSVAVRAAVMNESVYPHPLFINLVRDATHELRIEARFLFLSARLMLVKWFLAIPTTSSWPSWGSRRYGWKSSLGSPSCSPGGTRGACSTSCKALWRWGARVFAYAFVLVRDRYPPFSLAA